MKPPSVVVIGYGNELRGDDAAGPRVARAVARWGREGVQALAVHQLDVELAEPLSAADRAVFVDASLEPGGAVAVRPLAPAEDLPGFGHASDPRWLLALADEVFGRQPPAWLVTIPAESFGFGARLSELAARGVGEALREVARLVEMADP
jgi:hydrogenase maturation protease